MQRPTRKAVGAGMAVAMTLAACSSSNGHINERAARPDGNVESRPIDIDMNRFDEDEWREGNTHKGRVAINGYWQPFTVRGYEFDRNDALHTISIGDFVFNGEIATPGGFLPCRVARNDVWQAHIYSNHAGPESQGGGAETLDAMLPGTEGIINAVRQAKVVDNVHIHEDQFFAVDRVRGANWTDFDEKWVSNMVPDIARILEAAEEFCDNN